MSLFFSKLTKRWIWNRPASIRKEDSFAVKYLQHETHDLIAIGQQIFCLQLFKQFEACSWPKDLGFILKLQNWIKLDLRTILQNLLDSHQTEILEIDKLDLYFLGIMSFAWDTQSFSTMASIALEHVGRDLPNGLLWTDHSMNQEEMHAFCHATTIRAPLLGNENLGQKFTIPRVPTNMFSQGIFNHHILKTQSFTQVATRRIRPRCCFVGGTSPITQSLQTHGNAGKDQMDVVGISPVG